MQPAPALQPPPAANIALGTFTATLYGLFKKGARYSTVIDLGCADGHFYLLHSRYGLFPNSVAVNIDPNPIYENSLKAIKEALGGHYLIAAVTDRIGEVEMTTSVHPYWNSLCPEDHRYWDSIRHLHPDKQATVKVPTTTVDAVAQRFNLVPPFLIKLDVQGSEIDALRGARATLEDAVAVICEANLSDFEAINQTMSDSGFDLYDLTNLNWLYDLSFCWFYPVFLNRRLTHLRKPPDWEKTFSDEVVKAQVQRREAILKENAALLGYLRAQRNSG